MEIKEIWKDIQGYENLYQISSLGRVKSLGNGGSNNSKEKIIKQYITPNGYLRVTLSKQGELKKYLVHRLVGQAFIPNPDNKPEIDHIDTNPQNNIISNLRWVTRIENRNNLITLINYSKANKGKKLSQEAKEKMSKALSKPIVQYNLDNKLIGIYESVKQASELLNIFSSNISSCCRGKCKSAGGFRWGFLEDYLKELKKAG